jgi:hypothetical protein
MIWGTCCRGLREVVWSAIQTPTFLLIHSFFLSSCVSFGFAGSTDRWVAFKELGKCFSLCNHMCCLYAVCAKDIFNKPNDLGNMLQRFERGCWSTAIQTPTFLL